MPFFDALLGVGFVVWQYLRNKRRAAKSEQNQLFASGRDVTSTSTSQDSFAEDEDFNPDDPVPSILSETEEGLGVQGDFKAYYDKPPSVEEHHPLAF